MVSFRIVSVAALAVTALVLTTVAPRADTLSDIKQAKKIRISIDLTNSPYGRTDDKLQPSGSDVDIAKLLARDLGVEFEIVPTTGSSRIPLLQTGKADLVISSLSITPDRAKAIDFSVPYADLLSVVAGPKAIAVKSLADLDGKKVAVTRGTTQDTDLTQRAKNNEINSQIVRYEDDATLALAVASGQADLFATGRAQVTAINTKNPGRELEPKITLQTFLLAIGVRKGDAELLAWTNDWVKANLKNGKLNAINKAYHGVDLSPDVLKAGND
ncbi:MAG: amino acid transporter [Tardiphaga sp.]|jgi:polar amino acid transport system substrate-binding protein|nr:amino acid transporter [Tardiphaga sp.]